MTYTLASPPTRESKTICLPSGDQRGVPAPPDEVSCCALEPSLSHTHISPVPERFDMKMILPPSGEISGPYCSRVEVTRIRALAFAPSRSTRQIFPLI